MAKVILVSCRCETSPTRCDWLGCRGGRERDDGLRNGQADARPSDDAGRSASHSQYEAWRRPRADPTGTFVWLCIELRNSPNLRRAVTVTDPFPYDQNYEHLFKANAPPEVPPTPAPGARGTPTSRHSHYLQSKVVRARERIEAELAIAAEEPPSRPPPTSEPTAGTS